jgi:hypothetical protein
MAQSKRHHFIPQFYLKYFCNDKDGKIWVHDRLVGKSYATATVNCSVIKYFYSFELDDGARDDSHESALAMIETKVAPIFELFSKRIYRLDGAQREDLLYFIATMWFRNPRTRGHLEELEARVMRKYLLALGSDRENLNGRIKALKNEGKISQDVDVDKLSRFIKNEGSRQVNIHPNSSLTKIFELTNSIYPVLSKMKWVFAMAPEDDAYITSDHPIGMANHTLRLGEPMGLGLEHTQVYFPLNPRCCLIGSWSYRGEDLDRIDVKDGVPEEINEIVLTNTERSFYSGCAKPTLFETFKAMAGSI